MKDMRYHCKDTMKGCFFVLLNDLHNVVYNEENTSIDYTEAFQKAIEDINMNEEFLVSSMYNFSLVSNEMEENFMNEFNRNEPLEDEEDEMEKGDEEDQ